MGYLYQVFPSPEVRSISPFALKLETWLRLVGIKYVNRYDCGPSKTTDQFPFIELNGEQTADSNMIINRLKEHFGVDPDAYLSRAERSMGHVTTTMLENRTSVIGFFY